MTGVVTVDELEDEPITLDEAKLHLRVDISDDDATIAEKLTMAREYVENATGLALGVKTFTAVLDNFPVRPPYKIEIPRSTVDEITDIKYVDDNGVEQTMDPADYALDAYVSPARITPKFGGVWPAITTKPSAVRVTFTTAGVVAAAAKGAIKLLLGHFYENREATISGTIISELPLGVQNLLSQLKVRAHR